MSFLSLARVMVNERFSDRLNSTSPNTPSYYSHFNYESLPDTPTPSDIHPPDDCVSLDGKHNNVLFSSCSDLEGDGGFSACLTPSYYQKYDASEFVELVREAELAIDNSILPQLSSKGSSGTYFVRDRNEV